MSQQDKIEKIVKIALNDELEKYEKIVKKLTKRLPLFNGSKRIAAAVLKEYLGDKIDNLDLKKKKIDRKEVESKSEKKESHKKVIFEDVKRGQVRFFVSVGRNKNLNSGSLIKEIVKLAQVEGKKIGRIDIHANYSFFEVPESIAEKVYFSLKGAKINGSFVVVEPAKRKKEKTR